MFPPFNVDGNHEVFRLKGRHSGWQLTNTENCGNTQASLKDNGRRIIWRSTCDLIAGQNADGSTEIFMWSLEKSNSPLLSSCLGDPNCCLDAKHGGCYEPVFSSQMGKPPRPNCVEKGRCD